MRKLYAILALLALMAGGIGWLVLQDIPAPQQRTEQELDHEQFIAK